MINSINTPQLHQLLELYQKASAVNDPGSLSLNDFDLDIDS